MKKIKVVVLNRVIQEWRRPAFEHMDKLDDIDLTVLHGPSFEGTKVVNSTKASNFSKKELFSFKIKKKNRNGQVAMPVSPFLFFTLIRLNPDVIICEGASNLANDFPAFLYRVLFGKKIIWWSLGEIPNRKKSKLRRFLDSTIVFLEKKSDAIISYSSIGKEYFKNITVNEEKIFVAVNVVDTIGKKKVLKDIDQSILYSNAHKESSFNLLFVGALTKEKKIDVLLESFAMIEKKYSDIKLTIVGTGEYENYLHTLSKKLNLKNIIFTGQVFDGVEKYFIESDVFILPGLGGLAISEAMIYGLPVIASVADGCEKDLISKKNGIIDENLNIENLATYIEEFYLDENNLNKMKLESKYIIENVHNMELYIKNIHRAILYTQKNGN